MAWAIDAAFAFMSSSPSFDDESFVLIKMDAVNETGGILRTRHLTAESNMVIYASNSYTYYY